MRTFTYLVSLGMFLSSALGLHAETWTLDRAISTALKQSPDAMLAKQRTVEANALVQSAQSYWYPRVMIQGCYIETTSPMIAFGSILNQRAFNFGLNFNHPGQIDNVNGTGTIAYNVYSGGRVKAGVNAARAGYRAALEDLRASQDQLTLSVAKSYFEIIKAKESVVALTKACLLYTSDAADE